MKALYLNNCLSFKNIEKPHVKAGDILIKVAYAAVCRTDLYVMKASLKSAEPLIPGHEFSGVVELGNEVFKPGDRVIASQELV